MRSMREYLKVGGLLVGLGALVACGGGTAPTNTTGPAAATTARAATTAAAATVTRAATPATATRAASPAATATRAASPAAGTATRVGSPTAGAVAPGQAYQNLLRLDNYRQSWAFTGFTFSGLSGDLRPVYEFNGGNQKVTASAAGQTTDAYQVGGKIYVRNPLGGYVETDAANPLAAPAQALFDTPKTILTNLLPANATFTPAGAETVNGRQATRYTGNVTLADLGFVNPAMRGQRGTAATQVWVDNQQGYIVALEADIRAEAAGTSAKARLDVTDVGQVPPISVPR